MFSSATTRRGVLLSSGAASSLRRLPCVCVGLVVRVGGSGVPKGPVLLACARAASATSAHIYSSFSRRKSKLKIFIFNFIFTS